MFPLELLKGFSFLHLQSHDDYLLESPSCIRFLLELLKPPMSNATRGKAPSIGIKLLGLRKDVDILKDTNKTIDSSSAAIVHKVQEVLVSCKEMKSSRVDDNGLGRPELSPKWIALLTMEKACFSTISLEGNIQVFHLYVLFRCLWFSVINHQIMYGMTNFLFRRHMDKRIHSSTVTL